MYKYISDPNNEKKIVDVDSKLGKDIIDKYINTLIQHGGINPCKGLRKASCQFKDQCIWGQPYGKKPNRCYFSNDNTQGNNDILHENLKKQKKELKQVEKKKKNDIDQNDKKEIAKHVAKDNTLLKSESGYTPIEVNSKLKKLWKMIKIPKQDPINKKLEVNFSNLIQIYAQQTHKLLQTLNTENFSISITETKQHIENISILDIRPLNKRYVSTFWMENRNINKEIENTNQTNEWKKKNRTCWDAKEDIIFPFSILGPYRTKEPDYSKMQVVLGDELYFNPKHVQHFTTVENIKNIFMLPDEGYVFRNYDLLKKHKDWKLHKIAKPYKLKDIVYSRRKNDFGGGWHIDYGHKGTIVGSCDYKDCDHDTLVKVKWPIKKPNGKKMNIYQTLDTYWISKSKPLLLYPYQKYTVTNQPENTLTCPAEKIDDKLQIKNYFIHISQQNTSKDEVISGCVNVKYLENGYFVKSITDMPLYSIFARFNLYHSYTNYVLKTLNKVNNISGFCQYSQKITLITNFTKSLVDLNDLPMESYMSFLEQHKLNNSNEKLIDFNVKIDSSLNNIIPCKEYLEHKIDTALPFNIALKQAEKSIIDDKGHCIYHNDKKIATKHSIKGWKINKCKLCTESFNKEKENLAKKWNVQPPTSIINPDCTPISSNSNYVGSENYLSGIYKNNYTPFNTGCITIIIDFVKACQKNSNKFIMDLMIKGKDSTHANFLLFHKKISNNGAILKNNDGEIIWEIYRFDPNGLFLQILDNYLEHIFFKPYSNFEYKGLIWNMIKKHGHWAKDSNPSGTCEMLSCHVLNLCIMNPLVTIENITKYMFAKRNIDTTYDLFATNAKKCYIRLTEDLMARYFIELIVQTKGTFLDLNEDIKKTLPFVMKIFEDICSYSLISKSDNKTGKYTNILTSTLKRFYDNVKSELE